MNEDRRHARLLDLGWECVSLGEGLTTVWHPPFPHDRAYFAFEAPGMQAAWETGQHKSVMKCLRCAPAPLEEPSPWRLGAVATVAAGAVVGAALVLSWFLFDL